MSLQRSLFSTRLLAMLACLLIVCCSVSATADDAPPALRFARRDAERLAELAKPLTEQAQQAAEQVAAAEQTLSEAKAAVEQAEDDEAKAAAEKAVAEAEAALKPLVEARDAAKKLADEAEARVNAAAAKVAAFEEKPPQAEPQAIRLVETFKHNRPMFSCRFDSEGQFLFAGAFDNHIHRWDVLTGSRAALEGHRSWVRGLDLNRDGGLLVTGDYSGRLLWWNPRDAAPQPLRTVEAHHGYVRSVSFSPDGRMIATGGNDNLIRIWSAEDGSLIQDLSGHERHVYHVRFHPEGKRLVSGDLMGVVKEWDVETWSHVRDLDASVLTGYDKTFRADCGGIRGIDFSPDGKQLVVSGIGEVTNAFAGIGTPMAVLFDCDSGERLKVMKPSDNFRGTLWSVRFHPSGEFVVGAGGGNAGSLWFWKPGEEKSFFDFKLPQCGYDLAFHPDGLRLAVALYDQTVVLYDLGPKLDAAE